ncbi:hypothetical protein RxyAA322_13500 [Rubrobacter xylanophilus]|uniref:Uncharacterized protein n=1 Tax=Rubrobacter xylanophilus TaxID=49319 RepID=A0A510HHM0_9ACTN|nr:hypothetical protein [Rubrobacter xylanophilus]BBL79496.1 hypothetical protein RxyAA322_13500 [Rubrobacter xylanophilus]
MRTVQYRDPQTEEVLDWRCEERTPEIGERVRIGFEEYEVLFRWRSVPASSIVYVRPARVAEMDHTAA